MPILGQADSVTTLDDFIVGAIGGQYLYVRNMHDDWALDTAANWTAYIDHNGAVNGTYDRTADTWYTDVDITSGKGNLVNIISPNNLTASCEWDLRVTVDGVVYEKLGLTMPSNPPSYPKMVYGPQLTNDSNGYAPFLTSDTEDLWLNNTTGTPNTVFCYQILPNYLKWYISHPMRAKEMLPTIAFEKSLKVEQRMSETGPSSGYTGMAYSGVTYILRT